MARTAWLAFALFCCGLVLAQQTDNITGQWTIDGLPVADKVQLTIHQRSEHSNMSSSSALALDQLRGLSSAQMNSAGTTTRFEIVRDAGTLVCEGFFKNGSGGGTFAFNANPKYPSEMRSLGYEVSDEDVFAMAVHDVSTAYVRDLRSAGVEAGSTNKLLSMRIHNVTVEYIRELNKLGYEKVPADQLVAMRIHGVSTTFVRAMKDLGYSPDTDELVAMRIHGVSPEFAKELKDLGYPSVSLDQMVAMRIHGASTDFMKQIQALGYKQVPVDQLIAMRIHGVTPEYIQGLQARGMKSLSVDQLVSLRIHGIVD